jgi:hypothetical protein
MRGVNIMGRVLSQGEIDNMLENLLNDKSVLPLSSVPAESDIIAEPPVPAGIAAFKAKLAAMQATREAAE